MPSGARDTLCNEVLGIPPQKVRVVVDDVGGGFGMKTGLYPEDIMVAYAARELKRSVRWTAERIEEFPAATHGRDVESRAEVALDATARRWPTGCARSPIWEPILARPASSSS